MTVDAGNGQKWHDRVREGSIWPDPAGKRNSRTGRGHPDGFRGLKRPFSVGFSAWSEATKTRWRTKKTQLSCMDHSGSWERTDYFRSQPLPLGCCSSLRIIPDSLTGPTGKVGIFDLNLSKFTDALAPQKSA